MTSDLSPPRGSRDFLPQEKILRDKMESLLRNVFERYGFNPLETPALENYEVLSSKYAGGEEILKETYSLEDQGKRKLGLRYDLTVPLARVFAGQKLALPFKRYQIASVWRDGPIKAGRYREFTQCDVDVVGVASPKQEAELMALANDVFRALGIKAFVKVNSRKLLNGLIDFAGVPPQKVIQTILELDKFEKIGAQGVLAELTKILGESKAKGVIELFAEAEKEKSLRVLQGMALNEEGKAGLAELQELFSSLEDFGVPKGFVMFSPSLARGLNYYTGIVFEAFLAEEEESGIRSSIAAGGRYDEMIGKFAGSKDRIPAVGISFGFDVIAEVLKSKQETAGTAAQKSIARVLVIPFGNYAYALRTAQELRSRGVQCLIDLEGKGVSKNLDFANKQGIPFVVFCGEQEEKAGKIKLRDMQSGKEDLVSLASALAKLG
ncbi:TPA: histidine--tRNA ligase [Candidatus Micrarchaeota archaeon]|nr:histidine--tRNA ligase [Candidatus Micrarchaeota archaeon]